MQRAQKLSSIRLVVEKVDLDDLLSVEDGSSSSGSSSAGGGGSSSSRRGRIRSRSSSRSRRRSSSSSSSGSSGSSSSSRVSRNPSLQCPDRSLNPEVIASTAS